MRSIIGTGLPLSRYPLVLLLLASSSWGADVHIEGRWQLNLEESDKVAIKYKEGSGTGRRNVLGNASVSVGGLPVPGISSRIPSQSSMAPKNPEVLLCTIMDINTAGKRLTLTYDDRDKEVLRKGDYRGRTSTWDKKRIRQSYKTPDRKVTKTWTLRKDGRLLVEVKLDPPGDRARKYRRVFDRVRPKR